MFSFFFFFFFSSRRRHTRSLCDWSSDVCSSDLTTGDTVPCTTCMVKVQYTCRGHDTNQASFVLDVTNESSTTTFPLSSLTLRYWYTIDAGKDQERSEERRVGKECRCRGTPDS